jgi:hypothetical protein
MGKIAAVLSASFAFLVAAPLQLSAQSTAHDSGGHNFSYHFSEEFNTRCAQWGEDGLKSILNSKIEKLAGMPINQWGQMLLDEMSRFREGIPISDDITIVSGRMI